MKQPARCIGAMEICSHDPGTTSRQHLQCSRLHVLDHKLISMLLFTRSGYWPWDFLYSSLTNCDMLINKKNWNFDNTIPYTQRVLSRVSRTRYVTRGLIFIEEKPEVLKQFKLQERQNSRAGKIWNFGSIFNPWRRRSINWMRVFYDGTFPVPRE
jgi:hypothetical protein